MIQVAILGRVNGKGFALWQSRSAARHSLYRRVPKRYAPIKPRKFIWLSFHTDSESEAGHKAGPAWEQLVVVWEAKLAGDTSDAEQRLAAARDLAEIRGCRYMRVEQVAQLPKADLLARIEVVLFFRTAFRRAKLWHGFHVRRRHSGIGSGYHKPRPASAPHERVRAFFMVIADPGANPLSDLRAG